MDKDNSQQLFATQCLNAAVFPMNSEWYYGYFWFFGWRKIKVSNAWGSSQGLYSYLKKCKKNKNGVIKYTVIKSIKDLDSVIKSKEYGMGCIAFQMLDGKPDKAGHTMVVGKTTKNNIYFWAHTNPRDGEDTKGYGFRDMLRDKPNRQIVIIKIDYNYTWRS